MDFIPAPASITYPSRTGGEAHTVTFTVSRRAGLAGPAGTLYATCSCIAHVKGFRACWAVKAAGAAHRAVVIAR